MIERLQGIIPSFMLSRRAGVVLAVLGVWVGVAAEAHAHRVNVFADLEGNTVQVESSFSGGGPVRGGKVEVVEAGSGQTLLTGQTDDQGKFAGVLPARDAGGSSDLKVIVEASMGHRGEWLIKAAAPTPGKTAAGGGPSATAAATPVASGAPGLDRRVLEEVLNETLDAKLAPLKQLLSQNRSPQPALTDIIGGIGYIVGLCGIAAYFLGQRRRGG